MPHNTLVFATQILHKLLLSNTLGNMQCPQEHLKTIVYAKFGGQTKCIMGHSKIEIDCKSSHRAERLVFNNGTTFLMINVLVACVIYSIS